MSLTKTKLKQNLSEAFTDEENKGKKNDSRILNFYDLGDNEKLKVVLIPDEEGMVMHKFHKHGPKLDNPGVGSIACMYKMDGESCPVCAHGWSLYQNGDENSKKWLPKDYHVVQCVVVDDDPPIEIPDNEDGNVVKIFYMPFNVYERIKETIKEGLIEDPTEHVFVIKKTKNQGGRSSYANSYFIPDPIPDNIVEAFSEIDVEPYNLKEEGIIPQVPTVDEAEQWLERAKNIIEGGDDSGGDQQKDDSSDQQQSTGPSKDYDEDVPEKSNKDNSSSEKTTKSSSSGGGGSSLRDRINRAKDNASSE